MTASTNPQKDSDLNSESLAAKISNEILSLKNLAASLDYPVKDKDINSAIELLRLTISIKVKTWSLETLLNTAIDTEWGV